MFVQCFMIQGSLKQLRRGDAKTSFQRRGKTKFQGDGLICCTSQLEGEGTDRKPTCC